MRECDHLLGRPSYYFLLSLGIRSSEPAALLVHNLQPWLALLFKGNVDKLRGAISDNTNQG